MTRDSTLHTRGADAAARPRRAIGYGAIDFRWRVIDIVVASVLGVASALIFFAWNLAYEPVTTPFEILLPGSGSVFYGFWLFAGVLGGLVIRKPGAAIFTEVVAAVVSALLGAQWGGFLTIEAGLVQGLGAELVFLAFGYRYWRVLVAVLAGAVAGLAMAINDILFFYLAAGSLFQAVYVIGGITSGAVIAGLGSWLLMRALARTGALSRFAAGRTTRGPSASATPERAPVDGGNTTADAGD